MLPITLFRQNKSQIMDGLQRRGFRDLHLIDEIIRLDEQKRQFQQEAESIAARIKSSSRQVNEWMRSGKKEEADSLIKEISHWKLEYQQAEEKLGKVESDLHGLLVRIPNLPHEKVMAGTSAEDNEIIKTSENLAIAEKAAKPHWELAEEFQLFSLDLGTKITGSGFPVYMGKGARLQRALIQYFLDYNSENGYREYYTPHLVNETSAFGTGQLPDKDGQMYFVGEDNLYLIPTAEVPLTNLFRDQILSEDSLPLKLTGYTPCFRREAGSYGKDVRGLNRIHQFDKVEIVQITHPENSYAALEEMVRHIEGLIQSLGLPYRILRLCGGDMGFTSAMTYDFEVYSAGQQRWLEVSSVSNFESFQSSRMKIRYKDKARGNQLVHTLNGSSLALPRILASLLENHQEGDCILLPEVLHPYFGAKTLELPRDT